MGYTPSHNDAVNSYIKALDPIIQELLAVVRETILQVRPDLKEQIKWKNCLVYSTTKNLIQTVVGKGKISLLFFDGTTVQSDYHLLEGDGTKVRTLRIISLDFDVQALQSYFQQAIALAQ